MLKGKKHTIQRWLASGILMPALLLFTGAGQAVAAAPNNGLIDSDQLNLEQNILFAVSDTNQGSFNKYELHDLKFLFGGNDLLPVTYSARVTSSTMMAMQASNDFLYVEIDSPVNATRVTTNDPYFTVDELDEDRQWYLEKINIPDAWEYGTGSSNVVVAIIDTGIHASHLELNDGRVLAGYDAVNNKPIPADADSDENGHGTAVAGVIGAIANNNMGVAGVAWNVGLMPLRALYPNGSGAVSDVAESIVWAVEHGADIINLSLGGPGFGKDQTLNNSIIYAHKKGVVVVSAAGNDLADQGISLDSSPVYPVCADGGEDMIIGVVATDVNDQKASFSNYGNNCVNISAPGKKILTTAYLPSDPANNVLIYGSGTSLAAPLVSGVAALLKSNKPNLTNVEIKDTILRSTDNIDHLNLNTCLNTSCNGLLGVGRLNAYTALSPRPLLDGDLIRRNGNNNIYLIAGNRKRYVSDFVFEQRGYSESQVRNEEDNELSGVRTGDPVLPLTGTLLKSANDATVYYMGGNKKHAITYPVFVSRKLNFADVRTIDKNDLDDIPTGNWYWPPDGTMVLVENNPTVYFMEDGVKRPVTYFVFTQRGLSFGNVLQVTKREFDNIPAPPDQYWLSPLDNVLVKTNTDDTVYFIQDGAKKAVSQDVFVSRKFNYSDIKIISKAELQVIRPGKPLYN